MTRNDEEMTTILGLFPCYDWLYSILVTTRQQIEIEKKKNFKKKNKKNKRGYRGKSSSLLKSLTIECTI